jgi:hypothetical protein
MPYFLQLSVNSSTYHAQMHGAIGLRARTVTEAWRWNPLLFLTTGSVFQHSPLNFVNHLLFMNNSRPLSCEVGIPMLVLLSISQIFAK